MMRAILVLKANNEKVATFIVFFMVFWLLVVNDIFGIEKDTRAISHDIANRFVAPFYPHTPDKIKVILFDEETSDLFPVSYRIYANLLSAVVKAKPKVIFIDINFQERKNQFGKGRFVDVLKLAALNNIKVYSVINEKTDPDLKAQVIPVVVSWSGFGNFYPPHFPVEDEKQNKTAAFKIFSENFVIPEAFKESPLFIYWPYAFKSDTGFWSRLKQSFSLLLSWRDNKIVETAYFDSFSAQDFVRFSQENQNLIMNANIVMIGSSVELSNDKVKSPIYGQTPGVYLHAAALDNLIKFKSRYYKDEESNRVFSLLGLGSLIEWVVLLINLLIFHYFEQFQKCKGKEGKDKYTKVYNRSELWELFKRALLYTLCSSFLIIFSFWLSFSVFRVDPGNFIGLFTINFMLYKLMIISFMLVFNGVKQLPKTIKGVLKK